MPFLLRYDLDRSRPRAGAAFKDLLVRAIAPGVLVFLAIYGFGLALIGPMQSWSTAEEPISKDLESHRTSLWNSITMVWSHIGNTEYVIGFCVLMMLLVWWRTREWWFAVVPGIAIALQASIFVAATNLTDRPRPEVSKLDPAPPTSSYPSGHVGASTALYLTLAFMAHRIDNVVLRRVVQVVCVLIPLLVSYARLYRGMHHAIDVAVGLLNGIVCAVLAWLWLRRKEARSS
ncbi:phosphatase PAP2 family protein [Arsenicicoccus sp. oral taxon 190]|uniref:phosphatase PAP2 family protein n=1 Tax=Arsenicicoccus sp. oral taxon 190 TaxID=1658671 RepID=UPI00067A2309|nr:phosphatase PAP2 family protein [Arsenicicoccus sp. oral taxon 190]AKT50624.1 phospholipid phosphatase [Arsenicicoccus sp. oral taxon 190]